MLQRIVPLILAAMLLAGCGATATPAPAMTLTPPWTAAERAEYSIARAGQIEGTIVFTTTSKDGGYVLATETRLGPVTDITQVRVDKDLKPIGATHELTGAGQADAAIMTVYDKGKATLQAKTADGTKAGSVDIPANTWDNDQVVMSLRALPLAEGYTKTMTINATGNVIKTDITVASKEQVQTPAGSYTAYKVVLSFGSAQQTFWYDVNKPYTLVKFENPAVQRVFLLTKVGTP
jgi:ATP-dependent protease HslVU (ClpYQ) peptidase subunit